MCGEFQYSTIRHSTTLSLTAMIRVAGGTKVPSAVVPTAKKKQHGVGMMEPKPGAPGARPNNPFLTPVQAGDFVKLSWRTLERMRQRGEGPPFRKHGRYVRYHIDDLEAWSKSTMHGAVYDTPRA